MFFPPTYQDNEVTPALTPGDKRVWAALKVFVELREETSVHIPFREASKVCLMLLSHFISDIIQKSGLGLGWEM